MLAIHHYRFALLLLAGGLALVLLSACFPGYYSHRVGIGAGVYVEEVIVPGMPPSPPVGVVVTPGPAPGPGLVWVSGHWAWRANQYVWVAGSWTRPPHGRSRWIAPRYRHHSGGRVAVVPGHWE